MNVYPKHCQHAAVLYVGTVQVNILYTIFFLFQPVQRKLSAAHTNIMRLENDFATPKLTGTGIVPYGTYLACLPISIVRK